MGHDGGRQRLRELIRRYRPQVRADLLSEYGVDLGEWWRARKYRPLLDLIDQLPQACRLNEAVQNDPEQAMAIAMAREYAHPADGDEQERPLWSPPVRHYDLHAMLLREVAHNVAALVSKTPRYIPAPRTLVDQYVDEMVRLTAVQIASRYGFDEDDLQ